MTGHLAVCDLGKTNSKLFIFSPAGEIVDEVRTSARWTEHNGLRVLDEAHLHQWMTRALADMADRYPLQGLIHSGHGCTFALVGENSLTHPILDYEQEPPLEARAVIDNQIPPFSETFSPRLPLGFNFGRHMLWLAHIAPQAFEKSNAIVGYPQYWSWRFSGQAVSEVSYLGCHSHLWAPLAGDFSSLVDRQGWREKMPPLAPAGEILGDYPISLPSGGEHSLSVHNGVHDSNAALHCYRAAGYQSFTLVSTGTWVVIFNADCPLGALDAERDMLANVRVDGTPVPTIRFMGGREVDVIRDGEDVPATEDVLQSLIDREIFVLPSFAPGGPAPGTEGAIVGGSVERSELTALALLYAAMMTDLSLDLIEARNTVIIDGGLLNAALFAPVLGQLRADQPVLSSDSLEGSATGAAILALEALGHAPNPVSCSKATPSSLRGLGAYRDAWRTMVDERRETARQVFDQSKVLP